MSFQAFFEATWYVFLEDEAKTQIMQSVELVEREHRMDSKFHDYAFVVFPMAKAYESFLKKFFYTIGLIDRNQYEHRQFRIGRSLNPDIPRRYQGEDWLFGNLSHACGEEISRRLWDTWLECRNHLFHYYPDEKTQITLSQAEALLHQMNTSMRDALLCVKREY